MFAVARLMKTAELAAVTECNNSRKDIATGHTETFFCIIR